VQALQSILRQATGRDLVIEKRFVDRQVVVVAGTWTFKPLELPPDVHARRVYLYVSEEEERKAALESPTRGHIRDDAGYRLTELRTGDFPTFLQIVGFYIGYRVVDETQGQKPAAIEWGTRLGRQKFGQDPAALQLFFVNMQAQTSLRFEVAKRPIPLWYIREQSGTTRSGDAK